MENRDIVITGLQSWDIEIGSNCKNIALEFAKENRVLYVNPPMDRVTLLRNREVAKVKQHRRMKSGNVENPVRVSENLWVYYPEVVIESISRLGVDFLFDFLNKRNNRKFGKEILGVIKELEFSNFVHFCDGDMFRSFQLKEMLNPSFYIYYSRDNFLAVDYWKVQGPRIEALHMAKSDLVVANSSYLAELASKNNPRSYFVGQGCDVSAFAPDEAMEVPTDIAKIKKPIVGYIGALKSLRLDIDVLVNIATKRPDWSVVLVGPEDEAFKQSRLHEMENVYFLGSKNESELPLYLSAFDVAINPQTVNDVTIGNYPRKIDEYLAMGKPVVATRTHTMGYFAEHVSLVNDKDEWLEAIARELAENSDEKRNGRVAFANQHTWANSVGEIFRHVSKLEKS